MAQKNRVISNDILPQGHLLGENIDLSARFCYFLDLNNWEPPAGIPGGALKRHKQILYDNAKETLVNNMRNQLNNTNTDGKTLIQNAIDFLDKIAQNERQKEIAIINQYAKDLENSLPSILKNSNKNDIQQLIQRLNNFAAHPENENMDTFYEELTICLNQIRTTAQTISDRIKQLTATHRTEFKNLAADNMAFRFPSDVDGLIKNIIGLKARKVEDSFANNIQTIVIDYIDKMITAGKVDINNFWPSVIGVLGDFERYLMRQRDTNDLFKDFATLDKKELESLFNSYQGASTPFLHALQTNSQQLKELGEVLEANLGIKPLDLKDIQTRNDELYKRLSKTKTGTIVNYGQNLLRKNHPQLYDAIKYTDFIRWNGNGKDSVKQGRVGIEYEILNLIDHIGLNVKGHPATDSVTINLGQLTGDLNLDMTDLALRGLRPFVEEIENFEKNTRKDALNDLRNEFSQMNSEMARILHKLEPLIRIPEGKQLFIYHESLKLYTRIEQHKTDKFEGRDLQILGALDRIYSMNNLGGLILPDMDVMYNLVLNLSNLAVGGANGMRQELEDYLSIFAGMLMFDDISNMAQELAINAQKQLQYTNLKNIHMYKVNDIYLPGSMVLSYIHRALNDGLTHLLIQSGRAAMTHISVSSADKEIEQYLKDHPWGSGTYSLEDWDTEREEIAKNIHLKIIFLNSFSNLIRDLEEHFV